MKIPELKEQPVEGANLPYLYYQGGQSPIIFVHATGFLPWLWDPVIKAFVPQHSVWAPFICDYRKANPHEGGLSWDVISRDLSVFCRSLHIDNPLIIGHSMGATLSIIAGSKYGINACGMILIEPIFLPEGYYSVEASLKNHPLASKAIKRKNNWKNKKEAWVYLKSKPLFSNWAEEVFQLYLEYGMRKQAKGNLKLTCPPITEAALFMGGLAINPWPFLNNIECPVMIIAGGQSENKGLVDIQKMLKHILNGQYKQVANVGHLIPMQNPNAIIQIIKDFILKHELFTK